MRFYFYEKELRKAEPMKAIGGEQYELFLLSDLAQNLEDYIPETGKIYLSKIDNGRLRYLIKSPDNKRIDDILDMDALDMDMGSDELTTDDLISLKSDILKETSQRGHTQNYKKKFEEKLEWLQETWHNRSEFDNDELRLISPIIMKPTHPVDFSIIADNHEYFKEHYMEMYGTDLNKALKLACLCGSQEVAQFLLEKLHITYATVGYEFILGYACASNNQTWVKVIASNMVAQDIVEVPNSIYGYASFPLIQEIQTIFNKDNSGVSRLKV